MTHRDRKIFYLGLAIILLSISYVDKLFSVSSVTKKSLKAYYEVPVDLRKVADEIQGTNYATNPDQLKKDLIKEFNNIWTKLLIFIIWGVLTGLMVIKRNRWGTYNALLWATSLLLFKIWAIAKYLPDFHRAYERLYAKYILLFDFAPFEVIRTGIIAVVVYCLTIYVLANSLREKQFIAQNE